MVCLHVDTNSVIGRNLAISTKPKSVVFASPSLCMSLPFWLRPLALPSSGTRGECTIPGEAATTTERECSRAEHLWHHPRICKWPGISAKFHGDCFSCHNLKSVIPISTILWFSESLEKDLSNGVIKVYIWEIKVFANLAVPWIIYSPWSKAEKWQIMAPMKIWIEAHHLKGFFLSFQKIIKFLRLDQRY